MQTIEEYHVGLFGITTAAVHVLTSHKINFVHYTLPIIAFQEENGIIHKMFMTQERPGSRPSCLDSRVFSPLFCRQLGKKNTGENQCTA